MKSLMIIISLFFTGSFFSNTIDSELAQGEKTEISSEVDGPIITIKFDIGRKSKDCKRVGICSITVGVGLSMNSGPNTGIGQVTSKNGGLELTAPKSQMNPDLLKRNVFSDRGFVVEEAFEIPANLVKELNLERTVIEEGVYGVVDNGESFIVAF